MAIHCSVHQYIFHFVYKPSMNTLQNMGARHKRSAADIIKHHDTCLYMYTRTHTQACSVNDSILPCQYHLNIICKANKVSWHQLKIATRPVYWFLVFRCPVDIQMVVSCITTTSTGFLLCMCWCVCVCVCVCMNFHTAPIWHWYSQPYNLAQNFTGCGSINWAIMW